MNELTYEQRKRWLIEEIILAFDGVSREGGVSYTEARMLDDWGQHASAEDRAEAREQDTETRWQDVPEDDIGLGAGHSNLSFLDAIGFRYYLPAYLVWYLRYSEYEEPESEPESPYSGSNTFDSVLFALTVAHERDEFRLSRFRLFTPQQEKAIAHFLEFEAENQDRANIQFERARQEFMLNNGFSQEKIDAAGQRAAQFRREADMPDNDARRALERYWARFL